MTSLGSLVVTAASMLADGGHDHGPGGAAGHGGAPGHGVLAVAGSPTQWLDVSLRVLLLTGTAVLVGLALLRPFAARTAARAVAVAAVAAAAVVAALVAEMIFADTGVGYALAQGALTVATAVLVRYRPSAARVAALALLGVLVLEATLHLDGSASLVAAVQWLAAVAMLAGTVLVACADPADRPVLTRRFLALAAGGAALFVATGLLGGWLDDLRPNSFSASSTLGRLVALEVLLAAGGTALIFLLRSHAVAAVRASATVLAAAVAVTAGVAAAPPLPKRMPAGQPAVARLAVGTSAATVAVVPHRPGPNLVWVSGDGYRVGTATGNLIPAEKRAGAAGGWAIVNLPRGASTLWVARGDRMTPLRLDADPAVPELTGITSAQGPECLTAVAGSAIAHGPIPASCPDRQLAGADRDALRGMVRSLAARGVPGIRLIGGDSPRAAAASAAVVAEGARVGIPVDGKRHRTDVRIVVGNWAVAEQALITQAQDPVTSGVFLAPWLANGTLLGYSTGAVVVLNYDTTRGYAAEYIVALDDSAARALASPAGYEAWLAATGRPRPVGPPKLYAALAGFSMMGVDPDMKNMQNMEGMPGMEDMGEMDTMDSSSGGWIQNGRMAPVSKALSVS